MKWFCISVPADGLRHTADPNRRWCCQVHRVQSDIKDWNALRNVMNSSSLTPAQPGNKEQATKITTAVWVEIRVITDELLTTNNKVKIQLRVESKWNMTKKIKQTTQLSTIRSLTIKVTHKWYFSIMILRPPSGAAADRTEWAFCERSPLGLY